MSRKRVVTGIVLASALIGGIVGVALKPGAGGASEARFVQDDGVLASAKSSPLQRLVAPLGLDVSTARQLRQFRPRNGNVARELVSVRTIQNSECLVDIGTKSGASCVAQFFRDRPVEFLVKSDGGPQPESLTTLYVVGMVSPEVERAQLVDSSGQARELSLNDERAFFYEFSDADLREGLSPVAIAAFDHQGNQLPQVRMGSR